MSSTTPQMKKNSKDQPVREALSVRMTLTKEEEKKAQMEIEHWGWEVHEEALCLARQTTDSLSFGSNEPLLRKVSEEMTRRAQEKLRRKRKNTQA